MPKPKLPDKEFPWSPKLAYAIGLITTDGSLSKDGRHITFTSSDLSLLKTFRNCLNLKNKIRKSPPGSFSWKPIYRIQFGNVQLYRWLIKIGLSPNKTYNLDSIDIPEEYFRDFLRGWLDGDGSIFTYTDYYHAKKNPKYVYQRLYAKFSSASIKHLRWLQKTISKLTKVKGALAINPPSFNRKSRVSMGELKFSKKESIKLLNWIYYKPNLPCLKRKYEVARAFLENT